MDSVSPAHRKTCTSEVRRFRCSPPHASILTFTLLVERIGDSSHILCLNLVQKGVELLLKQEEGRWIGGDEGIHGVHGQQTVASKTVAGSSKRKTVGRRAGKTGRQQVSPQTRRTGERERERSRDASDSLHSPLDQHPSLLPFVACVFTFSRSRSAGWRNAGADVRHNSKRTTSC